jgi:glycosyltransferase involved in cell wall biosynthesis
MTPTAADVTVVIPAHNRAELIGACIASARGQDAGPPARILVVDDASTDDTATVAAAAGADVLRLERNVRAAGARNRGLAEVSTPWVAFLDSDDLWLPSTLQTLLAAADGQNAVSGTAVAFTGDRVATFMGPVPRRRSLISDPGAILRFNAELVISGSILKAANARAIGGFDETLRYSEDLDFWTRYLEQASVLSLPDPVLLYRRHEGGKSGDIAALQGRRAIAASYIGRPWWSRGQSERYYGGQLWNRVTRALRGHDWPLAARMALLCARHPRRVAGALRRLRANARLRAAYAQLPREVAAYSGAGGPSLT